MRISTLLLTALVAISRPVSGGGDWNAGLIADSLKKGADAVIRLYDVSYERTATDRYSMDVRLVITVLGKDGSDASELYLQYDRNTEISRFEGSIYDADGNEIQSISKKDVKDFAANNNYTLYSDNRVKYFSPAIGQYPYTVSYTYRIDHRGVVGFAPWIPLTGFGISVEKAELTFLAPVQLGLRFKMLNYDFEHNTETTDGKVFYRWSATDLPSIAVETHMPDHLDLLPAVLLTPLDISYEGSTGNFSDWKSYGLWVHGLIRDRDQITEDTRRRIREMTDTIPDVLGKTRMVYRYVQDRTRYVNISLGIGGFQPVPASEVDDKGYGDCKALSNYTKALLQSIGISSFYAEIGNGDTRKIKFPEFASVNQTNHVILCVPNGSDTIWLECTNQQIPFGYIGSGNANRYALLVTEEGGKLARTPAYQKESNTRISRINAILKPDGVADISLDVAFRNYLYEQVFGLINASAREQKEALLSYLPYSGLSLDDVMINDVSDTVATALLHAAGSVGKYGVKAGNRMLVEPGFVFDNAFTGAIPHNRKHDFHQDLGYNCIDTLCINIPDSYRVEYLPDNYSVVTSYGTYAVHYETKSNNLLVVTRHIEVNDGLYDPSQFEDINNFVAAILKQKKDRIILAEKSNL